MKTNEQVAIKTTEKDKINEKSDLERIAREIHILRKLRHPHVIQLYDVNYPSITLTNIYIYR